MSPRKASALSLPATWRLEEAKARLSEVVRKADQQGPQTVTVRGKAAAVVLHPRDYQRLLPKREQESLFDFLQNLGPADTTHLTRDVDLGREIKL